MKDIKQTESDTLAGNLTEDTLDHINAGIYARNNTEQET